MNIEPLICSICLAAQQNPKKLEHCVHSFCTDCIAQWLDIKNNCPLCLNLIGNAQHNKLLIKPPEQVEFDHSSLILQQQLKQIDDTMKSLQKRINTKHQQSKNLKSHFPKISLNYISDEMLIAKNYYSYLEQSILINDRTNTSMYMQMITEVLLDIQNVLNGGSHGTTHDDYINDQEEQSGSEEDQNWDDEDLEDYIHCQNARKEKARQKKVTSLANSYTKSSKTIKQ